MSIAARGNINTTVGESAPRLTEKASAFSGLTVVIGRALNRDYVTLIGNRAPGSSSNKGQAVTTIVVSLTAAGNGNTFQSVRAPRESSVTDTLSGLAIMIVRALSRNIVARVSQRAPVGSGNESCASSASISA